MSRRTLEKPGSRFLQRHRPVREMEVEEELFEVDQRRQDLDPRIPSQVRERGYETYQSPNPQIRDEIDQPGSRFLQRQQMKDGERIYELDPRLLDQVQADGQIQIGDEIYQIEDPQILNQREYETYQIPSPQLIDDQIDQPGSRFLQRQQMKDGAEIIYELDPRLLDQVQADGRIQIGDEIYQIDDPRILNQAEDGGKYRYEDQIEVDQTFEDPSVTYSKPKPRQDRRTSQLSAQATEEMENIYQSIGNISLSQLPRNIEPPTLGLNQPDWPNLMEDYLRDSDSEDEEDEQRSDPRETNFKRARKLRQITIPLVYRRVELDKIATVLGRNRRDIRENPVKTSTFKRAFKIWKEQWEESTFFSIWGSRIKSIEGTFGSGIGSYFRFLRFLFLFNISIVITNLCFIVVPHIAVRFNIDDDVDPYATDLTFKVKDFLTGGGWMESTELLYGAYNLSESRKSLKANTTDNSTILIPNSTENSTSLIPNSTEISTTINYSIPEAYFFTTGIIYIFWSILLAITMAKAYRSNFIDGKSLSSTSKEFSQKIFSGWDFAIMGEKAVKTKQRAMSVDLKEMHQKLARKQNRDKSKKKDGNYLFSVYLLRFAIWILTVLVLAGIGFATLKSLTEIQDISNDFIHQMAPSCIVALIVLVIPVMFSFLSSLSRYGSDTAETGLKTRLAMYATLFKTLLLQIMILTIVTVHFFDQANKGTLDCWENGLGQEMYRFLVLFLIGIVFITFIKDLGQNVLHWRFGAIPISMFDIASETTHLIYGQTITWLGLYFSPLLPLIFVIILVITFYIKQLNLYTSLKLSRDASKVFKPWRAAQSKTVFLVSTFVSLIIASFGFFYAVSSVEPSRTCGPFMSYNQTYDVLTEGSSSDFFESFIFYAPVVVGIDIVLLVILYYIYSMGISRHREVKIYQKKLKHTKRENYMMSLAARNFKEMMMKRPRNPVRRSATGRSSNSSRQSLDVGRTSDLLRRNSSRIAAELQRRPRASLR